MCKTIALLVTTLAVLTLFAYPRIRAASMTGVAVAQTTFAATEQDTANTAAAPVAATAADTLAANDGTHDDAADHAWDEASVVPILLDGDSIAANAPGVTVSGSTATITAAGAYRLSGTLADGQVIVDTADEALVTLLLDGSSISSSTGSPLYVRSAEEVIVVLVEGTQNTLADATTYVLATPDTNEPNAALFSAADLTIDGSGALSVAGNFNDGIASKDGLLITGGAISVSAVDDGIRGKDYLVVTGGAVTVDAGGDGLKADNEEDAERGYVASEGGEVTVTAGGDAIDAATDAVVTGGTVDLVAGGGSAGAVAADASAKGIKGTASVVVDAGTITIDAADDAIHADGSVTINGGALLLTSGDDGIHADTLLTIGGGEIRIPVSYEGIESAVITIDAGRIDLVASDDGVNVAGGVDSSGIGPGGGPGGSRQETFTYVGDQFLYINGGTLLVNAAGDGLDVNGAIQMTGGLVLVDGPTENMNAALDYDGGFTISGGTLLAVGSAGMAQAPDASSSQNALLANFTSTLPAGTLLHLEGSAGQNILTYAPAKQIQSLAFSSPDLTMGATYTIYAGGSASGAARGGLYQDAAYTPGSQLATLTLSGAVTVSGSSGGMGGRPRR